MPVQRAKGTPIPDPFYLELATVEWLTKRYPQVDKEIAAERFSFWAAEYLYANWQRTFQNYIAREADNNKLGPLLKRIPDKVQQSPAERWDALHKRAVGLKFRLPRPMESAGEYEQAMNQSNVTRLGAMK